jgi:hypothetical protein
MPHNFWKSLEYEGRKTQRADAFYSDRFKVEEIVRFDTGSAYDMEFQRQDIDVQLYGWNRFANVSEKFRDHDYNDLLLEAYSMYPNTKGWMHNSGANYLAYFFPLRMFWFKKEELYEVFQQHIEPKLDYSLVENWVSQNPKSSARIKTSISSYEAYLVIAYNRVRTREWHTVSVSVSFDMLKSLGVGWREFRL